MAKRQREGKTGQRPNKIILSRTLFLMVVCGVVAFIVLAVRLYKVQIIDHDQYELLAVEQQTRETTVTASRGTVYDTNGKILAMSATAETVYISPYEINEYGEDAALIAEGLSEILDVDYDKIIEKTLDTASWYKTIKTKIEEDSANEVRAFISENNLRSIHIETDTKRYYPYSSLACHILGFVGADNYGLEGIEAVYDDYLTGVNGRIIRMKNGEGTNMLFTNFEDYYDAEDGNDVALTIDVSIQYYAEKYLAQAVEDYDVQNGGSCIIMDVNTGEILAMASLGDYDPNQYLAVSEDVQTELDQIDDDETFNAALAAAQYKQWRNKAISDTYEPGSVFKIITLSMALDEGVVSTDDTFFCAGHMDVLGRGKPLNCWKTIGHGSQTLAEAVQNSCNVAFCTIGLRVGAETFYDYVRSFGFFDPTNIDLSGESDSQWWSENIFFDDENLSQLAAASFGQTFTITPIQLITAVSAAANGGYLMQPYIVKEITDKDGNVVVANEPTMVRQVISEETSDTVNEILESVVSGGTGKNAYVAGYRIAGKTGTSEKVSESLTADEEEYIVSFLGYAPANDPQVAVLLILDTPSNQTGIYISGGVMAAPVVGNILSEVLPYLGFEPNYTDAELDSMDVTVPYVISETIDGATQDLEHAGFTVRVVGDGDTVTDQLPAANAVVAAGTEIILYAGTAKPENTVTIPNLYGMSYQQAKEALESRGIYIKSIGALPSASNIVVSNQSVESGETVVYGSVIEVTLVDSGNLGRY